MNTVIGFRQSLEGGKSVQNGINTMCPKDMEGKTDG